MIDTRDIREANAIVFHYTTFQVSICVIYIENVDIYAPCYKGRQDTLKPVL